MVAMETHPSPGTFLVQLSSSGEGLGQRLRPLTCQERSNRSYNNGCQRLFCLDQRSKLKGGVLINASPSTPAAKCERNAWKSYF